MKKRNGFTLVEILIVVVILGILAAIVIPQFSDASEQANLSSLTSNLQTVRSQIQLYKIQHNGALPTATGFVAQLTGVTDITGATVAVGTSGAVGPYLQAIPKNPYVSDNAINKVVTTGTTDPTAASTTAGWFFNTSTGKFIAVDSVDHLAY